MKTLAPPRNVIRIVTAASLFDGHDASINVMRRILQDAGCEVIHLGHNRSVHEIVTAALQEDAQAIAVSSYQGGHMEFFRYMQDLLTAHGAGHIRIFGGGGGTIVPREIEELQAHGIRRIFSPEDGRRLGLEGMIQWMVKDADFDLLAVPGQLPSPMGFDGSPSKSLALGRFVTAVERESEALGDRKEPIQLHNLEGGAPAPVLGITGTGGAGKSSFTDEWVLRFLREFPDRRIAILAVDPTKRQSRGALLGDRIRMNAIYGPRVFMRSLATRGSSGEISNSLSHVLKGVTRAGFDLVIVETSGIGQGASAIVDLCNVSVYVMTPEYGAPSQLEKIDMLDFADVVVLNKFDRRGAEDALRDVKRQVRRSRKLFHETDDSRLPVYGAISSRFADPGVTMAFESTLRILAERTGRDWSTKRSPAKVGGAVVRTMIPPHRTNYLAEVSEAVRSYRSQGTKLIEAVRAADAVKRAAAILLGRGHESAGAVAAVASQVEAELPSDVRSELAAWEVLREEWSKEELIFRVRDREIRQPLKTRTLAGLSLSRVALPKSKDPGEILKYLLFENLPGRFPYTAGVFPLKRADEDPKRMFAGEGGPERTNERFHYLSRHDTSKRLSTAFDSVTLYGQDPDARPDIYGKVGESGVSICTLLDMKTLFNGFRLTDPNTSVSMTINGPAPIILAMFLNAAVDQEVEEHVRLTGALPAEDERREIFERTLTTVRGTVQADILKEDQAQNTCIFSTEFALRLMGDVQQYFIDHSVRNYYSVSISGYHIAEAGANPISQLAFTLANGFTYVEYYRARGMSVDQFAQNLSFFFSNGLDAEYSVMGRVARRIWAIAMRDVYGASERGQKLKYHIQTSGRSLHAQEIDFNDIRTTLQALLALQDQCNSLHTNAYDEAVTTPTEESVRRAMAIQMIINKEFGIAKNENPLQGSYIIEELTDLVEEAVLVEFDRIAERGGVLPAMESQYQRGRIQEESLLYERLKHSGELPIIGVNTYVNEKADHVGAMDGLKLTRASTEEKEARLVSLREFQHANRDRVESALQDLKEVAWSGGNVFAELMRTVRVASLGQITRALFEVGGEYRRNM